MTFRAVIARYLTAVKARAEAVTGRELTAVVHGRPVHFVDDDPAADRRAEDALRDIAGSIGFEDISFEYEPIAAALDYERVVDREEIALIADIGGGTADFSIVRIGGRRNRSGDRKERHPEYRWNPCRRRRFRSASQPASRHAGAWLRYSDEAVAPRCPVLLLS